MLAGEYSVLRGGYALACTVDAMMQVQVEVESSEQEEAHLRLDLYSDLLENQPLNYHFDRAQKTHHLDQKSEKAGAYFDAVSFCTQSLADKKTKSGFIKIHSQLAPNFGIGSSSALRLGLLFCFAKLQSETLSHERGWELARDALSLQRKTQGLASGYDIATQLLGGVCVHKLAAETEAWPGMVSSFGSLLDPLDRYVHLYVGGRGSATAGVVRDTCSWIDDHGLWPRLIELNDNMVESMVAALSGQFFEHAPNLFKILANQRELLSSGPHFPGELSSNLENLKGCNTEWSYKMSGAGGEDTLIVFADPDQRKILDPTLKDLGWGQAPFRFRKVKTVAGEVCKR